MVSASYFSLDPIISSLYPFLAHSSSCVLTPNSLHLSLFVCGCPQPVGVCICLAALRCCFPLMSVHIVPRTPWEIQPKLPLE